MPRCCFDCDYFEIEGKDITAMTEADWHGGCAEGECRFNPPVLGPEVESDGDTFRCVAEFPKVLSGDWCGKFEPRST